MFEDKMTVYNRVYDKATGDDKFFRTVIENVHFEYRKGANVNRIGLEQSDSVFVAIPYSSPNSAFVEYTEFALLDDKDGFFTLKAGDIICHGAIEDEITSIKEFAKKHEYFTITSVDFYGSGSEKMRHWELGAK